MKMMKMDTGKMPEKIIDFSRYQLSVLEGIHETPSNSNRISKAAAQIVISYFEQYYANLARRQKYLYQHVYEFGKAGDNDYKLFKPTIQTKSGMSKIQYSFTDSKIPNKNGYIFKKKAEIMESGKTVKIEPKKSSVLMFEVDNKMIFTKSPVIVKNPGGEVSENFQKSLEKYIKSQSKSVLLSSGFYKDIAKTMDIEAIKAGKAIERTPGAGIKSSKNTIKKIVLCVERIANDWIYRIANYFNK